MKEITFNLAYPKSQYRYSAYSNAIHHIKSDCIVTKVIEQFEIKETEEDILLVLNMSYLKPYKFDVTPTIKAYFGSKEQ